MLDFGRDRSPAGSSEPSEAPRHRRRLTGRSSLRLRVIDATILVSGPILTGASLFFAWIRWYRWSNDLYFNGILIDIFMFQLVASLASVIYLASRLSSGSENPVRATIAGSTFVLSLALPVYFGLHSKAAELGRAQVESEIGSRRVLEAECRQLLDAMNVQLQAEGMLKGGMIPKDKWPPGIRRLKPHRFYDEGGRLKIEFGSGFTHYGYSFGPDPDQEDKFILRSYSE